MKRKKDLPLIIVQKLAPFVGKGTDLFKVELKNNTHLMEVYDLDDNSDFHFFVKEYKNSNNHKSGIILLIESKPYRSNKTAAVEQWIEPDSIDAHFSNWLNLLKQYNDTPSFYDDPILSAYQEEYFSEFTEVIPEEEKEKPFTINQQLALDRLFEQLKLDLTTEGENRPETTEPINEIKEEISNLQENIHLTGKLKVISKVSKILGKIAKLGLPFIKKFGDEAQKEFIKKIIGGISTVAENIIN